MSQGKETDKQTDLQQKISSFLIPNFRLLWLFLFNLFSHEALHGVVALFRIKRSRLSQFDRRFREFEGSSGEICQVKSFAVGSIDIVPHVLVVIIISLMA